MLRERDLIGLIRQGRAGAPRAQGTSASGMTALSSAPAGAGFSSPWTSWPRVSLRPRLHPALPPRAQGGRRLALGHRRDGRCPESGVRLPLPAALEAGRVRPRTRGGDPRGSAGRGGGRPRRRYDSLDRSRGDRRGRGRRVGRAGPILRSGARTGDRIYVSGLLGGSAAGRELLRQGFDPFSARAWAASGRERRIAGFLAAMAHLLPRPRLALGRALAVGKTASAMIDLSDGLSTDLHNLCEASRVGAVIEAGLVPLHPALLVLAGGSSRRRKSPARHGRYRAEAPWPLLDARGGRARAVTRALSGGEDYELLFTAPAASDAQVARLGARVSIPVTRIGRIVPRGRGLSLIGPGGSARPLPRTGWEHFRR